MTSGIVGHSGRAKSSVCRVFSHAHHLNCLQSVQYVVVKRWQKTATLGAVFGTYHYVGDYPTKSSGVQRVLAVQGIKPCPQLIMLGDLLKGGIRR
jgi:hypothetical protein